MGYKMTVERASGAGRVAFKTGHWAQTFIKWLMYLMGLPATSLGLLMLLLDSSSLSEPLMVLGLGMFTLGGGLVISIAPRAPRSLVFDNALGAVEILERARLGRMRRTLLPYSELSGFDISKHVSSSSSSSGGSSQSVTWQLDVHRMDGAVWGLSSHGSNRQRAQKALDELREVVDLSAPLSEPVPSFSDTFTVKAGADGADIVWKRPDWLLRMVYSTILLFGGLMGVTGLWLNGHNALLVLVLFFAFTLVMLVYNAVHELRHQPTVRVGRDTLFCNSTGGIFKRTWTMPVEDLGGIVFHFSPQNNNPMLLVLTHEQAVKLRPSKVDGALDALNTLTMLMSAHKINGLGLSVGQLLELERLVQEQLEQVSGRLVP